MQRRGGGGGRSALGMGLLEKPTHGHFSFRTRAENEERYQIILPPFVIG